MNTFTEADIRDLDVALKVGILATINPQGQPHLTMLSSLRPYEKDKLVWGQFTEGLSKTFIQNNPKTGFLIMSLNKEVWFGKAQFTHKSKQGAEIENYNNLAMFRYNAYFGIHTVYYMDLISNSGRLALPMGSVIFSAVKTMAARFLAKKELLPNVLNPWVRALFNKLDNLKFISYIDQDGFPIVLPVIQTQALDSHRILFATGAYTQDLSKLPKGTSVAVFAMSFDMEDVLLRGEFAGVERIGGFNCGVIDIDWVYNAMPPKPQQIYPSLPVEAVREF